LIQQDTVDLHRAVNILELVLTNILEGDAEPAETRLDTQTPPASANASSRAATFIPSP
jgi:hypothetical protein